MSAGSQAARTLLEMARKESIEVGKRNYRFPEMGYVRRVGADFAVQPSTRQIVLTQDQVVFLQHWNPARGDKCLLVPLTQGLWGIMGPLDEDPTPFLSPGEVKTSHLDAGAVTSAKLGAGAVTTAKIGDGEVTAAKLAADVVVPVEGNTVLLTQVFS